MNPLYSYLSKTALAQLDLPPQERMRLMFVDRFVAHERVAYMIKYCEFLMRKPPGVRPTGLLVTCPSGSGKTTMAEILTRRYPPMGATPQSAATFPVIYLSMTDAREAKEIYTRMLKEWKVPYIKGLTLEERRDKVVELATVTKLRLIIIDEVQDVLLVTPRQQVLALLAIKFIMNTVKVPVLALGTQDARASLAADQHLDSRFEKQELPTWIADGYFRNFLEAYLEQLPLKKRSDLTSQSMMDFIIKETGGLMREIIKRLQRSAALAIQINEERITKEIFVRTNYVFPELEV
ncbi:TniB family NTP-binding protein [Dyella nitratireducens]|uniref:Transposase n=1 Tax=Dyella nitratireducens TaxID=1849580 RepID=A0ABQ1GBW2_9GAMM|nr:TniB family NTP-binding protein [Dyella nitratireducens]GGA40663.1 transposase [Dyella nitratireducens]GLQ40592.1 transposase [Dyella nitratireducens]